MPRRPALVCCARLAFCEGVASPRAIYDAPPDRFELMLRTKPDRARPALRSPTLTGCLGLIALLLSWGVFACTPEPDAEHTGRVLVVGLDGATLLLAEPLMDAGRLPHLESIARRGAYGVLRSYPPLESPRIWTSIATGKTPRDHDIKTFTKVTPEGTKRLVSSEDRKGWALWNMLSSRGLSVSTVNWWVTYPPEVINGVMVSDHFLPGVVAGRMKFFDAGNRAGAPVVHPLDWRPTIDAVVAHRLDAPPVLPRFKDAGLPAFVRPNKLSEWYLDDRSVGEIALEVEARQQPDLMMVLLKGIDAASHVLFATTRDDAALPTPLPVSAEERAAGAEALYAFYEQSDAILGQLLARYGPDDLILVVSDHGFEARSDYGALTGQHKREFAQRGILFARGRGIEPGSLAQDVDIYDITPTLLTWLGLPIGEDMVGSPAHFLDAASVTRIPSWDGAPVVRVGHAGAGSEAEIMEQLEALGYFESEEAAIAPQEAPEAARKADGS
jgi:hypothetical protein